jgi:hypothetical protein
MERVKPLRGQWGKDGDGYVEKYGLANYQRFVKEAVDKKYCNIADIMNHVVLESIKMYEGTNELNTFVIFHDGLKQWWEKEAQEHMASLGFRNRQLRCLGNTNSGTIYEGKLVGNSPEICRGLDSHGFADLEASVLHHTALTAVYAIDDQRAFRMGTPAQVWSTLSRCWQIAPSSERIVQDISKLKFVLQKIIEANGCVVRDEALRSGVRYVRADKKVIT